MFTLVDTYAGYWALVVLAGEAMILLGLLWKRTRFPFFRRWLLRLSWLLPVMLYLAYRIGDQIPDPRAIRSFESYLLFLTRLAVRDTEFFAAHSIPYLSRRALKLATRP